MLTKQILSAFAIALTLIAFLPYIYSILRGMTRPHIFSWVIWGSTTFIVFLAQLADGAGVGAWPIGVSGIITIYIAMLAYSRKADASIKVVDWVFFTLAMASLPVWFVTSDPVWAVIILTFVDVLGFGPTIRKAHAKPYEEQLALFVIMTLRNVVVITALENYSITTVLFPAALASASTLVAILIIYRRRMLPQQAG